MTKAFRAARNLTKSPASTKAEDRLMDWLKEQPQTYGWGAILGYDRQKSNKMLKQEYINRFNSESIMLPVTLEVSGGGERKQMYGYEFDAPLMSFENYSDSDIKDEPRCVVRLPIIAGSYKTLAPKGIVTSISVLDPLDGQILSMIMDLKTGKVNDKNQVVFNIKDGTDFRVDVNENYLDQVDVGDVFKAYFVEQVPDDQKRWVLSQIDTSKNKYLRPETVKLLVHKREGAAEIADGELIVCVGMVGDDTGTSLPDDFEYLTASNSATLLLGQKTLFEKVVIRTFIDAGYTVKVEESEKGWGVVLEGGALDVAAWRHDDYPIEDSELTFRAMIGGFTFNYASYGTRTLNVDENRIVLTWKGHLQIPVDVYTNNNQHYEGGINIYWDLKTFVTYEVLEDGRGVVSSAPQRSSGDLIYDFYGDSWVGDLLPSMFKLEGDKYLNSIFTSIVSHGDALENPLPEINTFVLESILFENEDTVTLSSSALPNDLVMFGEVGPTQTAYEITPMEAVVLKGRTQQFTLTPQGATGVTWSVESTSGEPLAVGSIDPSGLYTAPNLDSFQGTHVRERVIATHGDYKTYALVSVIKKTITVNPLVTVKVIGEVPSDADKVVLTANSADGVAPTWRLNVTGTEGKLAETQGFTNVYTPRPYDEVDADYIVDEIILTDSSGTEHRAIVVVEHAVAVNSGMTEGSSTANTVQLQCKVGKEDVTDISSFNVLLGGTGNINETGLYTQADEIDEPFALVDCVTEIMGKEKHSFILIPLPLTASTPAE